MRVLLMQDVSAVGVSELDVGLIHLAAPLHGRPKDELDSEDLRQHP
jgi:hypothetical protein